LPSGRVARPVARPELRAAPARPRARQGPRQAHHKTQFQAARDQHRPQPPVSRSAFHRTLARRGLVQPTTASRTGPALRRRPRLVNPLPCLADRAAQPDRRNAPAATLPQRRVQERLLVAPHELPMIQTCQKLDPETQLARTAGAWNSGAGSPLSCKRKWGRCSGLKSPIAAEAHSGLCCPLQPRPLSPLSQRQSLRMTGLCQTCGDSALQSAQFSVHSSLPVLLAPIARSRRSVVVRSARIPFSR
jgi:hypothetical protein